MDNETLINKYFEKSLSEEEQKQFVLLMETNVDFAKEVSYQKGVNLLKLQNQK